MIRVPISGQVTGKEEADLIMQVANSQHYGGGIFTDRFERGFAQYMGARHAILCNSGSSALLLALSALEMPKGSKVSSLTARLFRMSRRPVSPHFQERGTDRPSLRSRW